LLLERRAVPPIDVVVGSDHPDDAVRADRDVSRVACTERDPRRGDRSRSRNRSGSRRDGATTDDVVLGKRSPLTESGVTHRETEEDGESGSERESR
jgi:hypothetical protein